MYLACSTAERCKALVLIGILLSGCSLKKHEPEEAEHVVTVDVAPVLSSQISLKVTADALLYPLQQAAIVPKISAPVKKFYVERGSRDRNSTRLNSSHTVISYAVF